MAMIAALFLPNYKTLHFTAEQYWPELKKGIEEFKVPELSDEVAAHWKAQVVDFFDTWLKTVNQDRRVTFETLLTVRTR
jgi:hypothetical protein